jgi:hypothetical protein
LFFKHSTVGLEGVVLVWVNDFFHAGTTKFETEVVKKLQEVFTVGRVEQDNFTYTGLHMVREELIITIDQDAYIESLTPALLAHTGPWTEPRLHC